MKKIIYFGLILVLSSTFNRCTQKEIEEPDVPEWSKFKTLMNGEIWETGAAAFITNQQDRIFIQANVANAAGFLREEFRIFYLPIKVDTYTLFTTAGAEGKLPVASYNTVSDDGDVTEDRFILLQEEDNYFKINSIKSDTTEISGQFQMTFVRNPIDKIDNFSLPDTIRFTNGITRLFVIK